MAASVASIPSAGPAALAAAAPKDAQRSSFIALFPAANGPQAGNLMKISFWGNLTLSYLQMDPHLASCRESCKKQT